MTSSPPIPMAVGHFLRELGSRSRGQARIITVEVGRTLSDPEIKHIIQVKGEKDSIWRNAGYAIIPQQWIITDSKDFAGQNDYDWLNVRMVLGCYEEGKTPPTTTTSIPRSKLRDPYGNRST